jgi:hypothetical protein
VQKGRPYFRKKQSRKGWRHGLSSTVPASQPWSLCFKPITTAKTKKSNFWKVKIKETYLCIFFYFLVPAW